MKKRFGAILASLAVLIGVFGYAVAPASASTTEAYGPWWALPTGYGDRYGNANWLNLIYTGDIVNSEAVQVQNLNEPQDAFSIEICSVANCEVYGPLTIGYGDAWLEIDAINELWAVPGYSVYYEVCEYAVGCTAKTLTLFNKINDN